MTRVVVEKKSTTHHLYHGAALQILPEIPSNSVELIFADPPYNIGKDFGSGSMAKNTTEYLEWCELWIDELVRVLCPTGSMYIMNATQFMPYVDIMVSKRLHVLGRVVWHYDSSGVQAKKRFGSMYEPILHCVSNPKEYTFNLADVMVKARTGAVRKLIDYRKSPPQPYSTRRNPGNVWYFPRVRFRMPEYTSHPSQKPELLLERIILASSNPGNTVLDPFAGTFTTCAVAAKLRRNSIGCEISQEYFGTGVDRVKRANEGTQIANKHNHDDA